MISQIELAAAAFCILLSMYFMLDQVLSLPLLIVIWLGMIFAIDRYFHKVK